MSNLFVELLLVLVGLSFTILLLRYAFSSELKSKEVFTAIDGTRFSTEKSCSDYDYIYKNLEVLYQDDALSKARTRKQILGLRLSFVNQIKSGGFSDLKTLLSFKDDFPKLAEILDPKEILAKEKSKYINIKV